MIGVEFVLRFIEYIYIVSFFVSGKAKKINNIALEGAFVLVSEGPILAFSEENC